MFSGLCFCPHEYSGYGINKSICKPEVNIMTCYQGTNQISNGKIQVSMAMIQLE